MADAVIGALRVVLGADTAAFQTAMKETENRLQALGTRIAKAGAVMAGAFAGVGVAIAAAVRSSLAETERLGDVATQLGMPIEQLTGLKHAAEQSGASLEALHTGMRTMMRNMASAAADGRSAIGQAFASIGVSVTDASGQLRASGDVMLDIADKMANMRDGAGKTALQMELFGKQGAELARFLNSGRDGIQGLTAEAQRLGLVMSTETVASAQRFNDNLALIGKTMQALVVQITARLAPALAQLSQKMVEFVSNGEAVSGVADTIAGAFRTIIRGAERVSMAVSIAKLAISSFWDEAGNETSIREYFRRLSDGYARVVEGYKQRMAQWDNSFEANRLGEFGAMGRQFAAQLNEFEAPIQGAIKRLREQFQFDFGDPFAGVARKMELLNEAVKRGTITVMEYRTMMRQLQVQEMAELRAAARVTLEQTLASGAVTAAEKMRLLEQAVRAGTITFQEFAGRAQSVMSEAMANVQSSIDAVSSGIADAFRRFTETGKWNFREMARSILADLAQIMFRISVLKPLFGDGGSNSGVIGALLGNAFKGIQGFAQGGRPQVGMPAWVGERGRELFVPDSAGTIVPNHMLHQLSSPARVEQATPVTLNIDARGATRDAVAELEARLPKLVIETVAEARDRGMIR